MKILAGALILAYALTSFSGAQSLIENGEFSESLKPWKVFSMKETPGTEKAISEGVLTINAAGASEKAAARQLSQIVELESAKKYKLSFDAKATLEKGKELNVVLVRSVNPKKPNYGLWRKVELTPEWKTHTFNFNSREIDPADPPVLKFQMGELKGEISFRKVVLTEGKDSGRKESEK